MLKPAVDAWFAAHPEIWEWLDRHPKGSDQTGLGNLMTRAGVDQSVPAPPSEILYDYRFTRPVINGAARLLVPNEVAAAYAAWAPWNKSLPVGNRYWFGDPETAADRSLTFLIFTVPFQTGGSRTVTVSYLETAAVDERNTENPIFQHEYLLSPARNWAGFGPLTIPVVPPAGEYLVQSNLPLKRQGDRYHVLLPGLPESEFTLTIRPTAGMVLGLTRMERRYSSKLLLMLLFSLVAGVGIGHRWATPPLEEETGCRGVGLRSLFIFGVNLLGLVAANLIWRPIGWEFIYWPVQLLVTMVTSLCVGAIWRATAKIAKRTPAGR